MNSRLETALTAVSVLAATAVAAAAAHREFGGRNSTAPPKLEYISNWRELLTAGRRIGDSSAPVKLIEFADLQCPYCRAFNEILRQTTTKYGTKVEFVFVHFPLPGHPVAIPAARAAECAHSQGKFQEFTDFVYLIQDSLAGLEKSGALKRDTWMDVANKAGVPDAKRFLLCIEDPAMPTVITAGVKAAGKFVVHATPTVIVNGWRFREPPLASELHQRIDRLLAGKAPVSLVSRLFSP